jgi:hypothetical protein
VSESVDPVDGEIRWQGSRQAERPALSIAKLNAVHAGGERAGNRITWNHFFFPHLKILVARLAGQVWPNDSSLSKSMGSRL